MEFDAEDVIALYLLEHPEDEVGFGTVTFEGEEDQVVRNDVDVMVRLGRWGIERGYFHQETVEKFMRWAEQSPAHNDMNDESQDLS